MQYLIKMKGIENVLAGPPEANIANMENMILPTLKTLAGLEKNGKITGGAMAGRREIAFVMDFPSNDEAGKFVMGLPWWPLHDCEVIALQPIQSHVPMVEQAISRLKAMVK
jgi:hypothetical protein